MVAHIFVFSLVAPCFFLFDLNDLTTPGQGGDLFRLEDVFRPPRWLSGVTIWTRQQRYQTLPRQYLCPLEAQLAVGLALLTVSTGVSPQKADWRVLFLFQPLCFLTWLSQDSVGPRFSGILRRFPGPGSEHSGPGATYMIGTSEQAGDDFMILFGFWFFS